jgi:hypothetical protein
VLLRIGPRAGRGRPTPLPDMAALPGCLLFCRSDAENLVSSSTMTNPYSPQGASTMSTSVTLTGTPAVGVKLLLVTCTQTGDRTSALFSVSFDGGADGTPLTNQAPDGSGNLVVGGVTATFAAATTFTAGHSFSAFPLGLSQWNDLTGRGHHLVTVNGKPGRNLTAAAALRGRFPVGFLGNATISSAMRATFAFAAPYTIAFVASRRATSVGINLVAGATANNPLITDPGGGNISFSGYGASTSFASALATPAYYELAVGASTGDVRKNNVVKSALTGLAPPSPTGITIARSGTGTASTSHLDIWEIGVLDHAMTANERARHVAYISRTYGLI